MVVFGLLALVGVAEAATPNPDRPSVSRSGALIAPSTAELELGVGASGGAASIPFTMKAAAPRTLELRLSGDVMGATGGTPGLVVAGKIAALATDEVHVAVYLDSALPFGAEVWSANAHALGTFQAGLIGLQLNAGVTLGPGGDLLGVPLAIAIAPPSAGGVSTFVEFASVVNGGLTSQILTVGAGLNPWEDIALDAGVSYLADVRAVAVTVGGTINVGRRD